MVADSARLRVNSADEPAALPCSCLSPRRWKKGGGGGENNELSDIVVDEFIQEPDIAAAAAEEREQSFTGLVDQGEDKDEEREAQAQEPAESGGEAGRVDSSNKAPNVSAETSTAAIDVEDKEKAQDDVDGDINVDKGAAVEEVAEKEPVTSEAAEKDAPTDDADKGADDEGKEADKGEKLKMGGAGKSLLKLAKTRPKPQTPKRALFDDIPDDESEASIEVLFRYMGCTEQAYGERPTISATMTMETAYTYETSKDDNDLIENIETLESATDKEEDDDDDDDDDETMESMTDKQTTDDNVGDVLHSPSGKLLVDSDEDDDGKQNSSDEGIVIVNEEQNEGPPIDEQVDDDDGKQSSDEGIVNEEQIEGPPIDEQVDDAPSDEKIEDVPSDEKVDDTTPTHVEQVDDTTPFAVEQVDDSDPTDQSHTNTHINDEQLQKVTQEQTRSTEAQAAVFNRLTVDTKADDSGVIFSPIVSQSAAMDRVISRMSHSAMSPSVRKIAVALYNAPKYPTTDYTIIESSDKENTSQASASETGDDNEKDINREAAPTEMQGEQEGVVVTSTVSGPLSKVEEMDKLIKSTRAWLEQQKAERKVMDNITVKALSPKNETNAKLPEMKKLDTSLLDVKSPLAPKTPSSAQPLSPRTLDSLLLSRKSTPSDGPKRSILEQLEEIRARQRERESLVASPR